MGTDCTGLLWESFIFFSLVVLFWFLIKTFWNPVNVSCIWIQCPNRDSTVWPEMNPACMPQNHYQCTEECLAAESRRTITATKHTLNEVTATCCSSAFICCDAACSRPIAAVISKSSDPVTFRFSTVVSRPLVLEVQPTAPSSIVLCCPIEAVEHFARDIFWSTALYSFYLDHIFFTLTLLKWHLL